VVLSRGFGFDLATLLVTAFAFFAFFRFLRLGWVLAFQFWVKFSFYSAPAF